MSRDAIVGAHLASLRDAAGLKQIELAKKLDWSAAMLSRIESGDRTLTDEELANILLAIGTPESSAAADALRRTWRVLQEPPLGDPDSSLLWDAESVAVRLRDATQDSSVSHGLARRLERYLQEVTSASAKVVDKNYKVVFIGIIGTGKSTAICRLGGLETGGTRLLPKPVLETGAGGITICEVHISQGPRHGIMIDPCSEDEVRRYASDFAAALKSSSREVGEDSDDPKSLPGVPREIERALRNMSGLKKRRAEKRSDGSTSPATDDARQLAETKNDPGDLAVELLARMNLHKRDQRSTWFPEGIEEAPLQWLNKTFEKINNGRHDSFSIPRRIEIIVPSPPLKNDQWSVTLIDTQGIDDLVGRKDLEDHFDNDHTVEVLCTVFNEAPAIPVRQLLTRVLESGARQVSQRAVVLVLPRPSEAMAMKDSAGDQVQDSSQGYELKGDEARTKLQEIGLGDLEVEFFNSVEDDPDRLRAVLVAKISAMADQYRSELADLIQQATTFLDDAAQNQARIAVHTATNRLAHWLDQNSLLNTSGARPRLFESLTAAVGTAHAKTLFASITRDGIWKNLNYAHQLSHGARRIATHLLQAKVAEFHAVANNLSTDPELSEARDILLQAMRLVDEGFDGIIRRAHLIGGTAHSNHMSVDESFWSACVNEWGQGGGFRSRVNARNRDWFKKAAGTEAEMKVVSFVETSWRDLVAELRTLLPQSP